jgi:hypothetical protein
MISNRWEVPVVNLRTRFDPQRFPFTTTEELPNLEGVIGQEPAVRAMEFGRQVQGQGYNIDAVSTADEALEILMGCPAGEQQPNGSYPAGSINAAVLHRLHEMNDRLHALETRRASRQAKRPPRTSLPSTHSLPAYDQCPTPDCFMTGRRHGRCISMEQVQGDVILPSRFSTIV